MIRPVEMQMILPQTNQVGMQQHTENQHAAVQSAQSTTQLAKEVKQNSETVIPKEDPDLLEYRYDAKEKGNNSYEGQSRKRKRKNQDGDSQENTKENMEVPWVNFDIKV